MTIIATVNVSPQYQSVPNYASVQAAIDQIITDYSGDITGEGALQIWVNGAQSTGNIDTPGLTSDATGYLEIIGINLPVWTLSETLQPSNNVSTQGYHILRGFHFQPAAGFSGSEVIDHRWGCRVYDSVLSNPNSINCSGIYASSAATDCDVDNVLSYGFDNALTRIGVWSAVGTISNCTSYSNGRGFGGNAGCTTIDCVALSCTDTDFESDIGQSYNGSSDATATGTGSLTSLVATDEYVDPVNGDFTLKTGNSIDAASSTGGAMGYVEVLHDLPSAPSSDQISSIADLTAGSTATLTTDGTTDLTASSTATVSIDGGSALPVTPVTATTGTFTVPTDGFELGSAVSVVLTVDGNSSSAFSDTFEPALGAFVTLTVDYANLHPDSPMYGVANYAGLVAGDQVEYDPLTHDGYTVSIDSEGLVTITGAGADPDHQEVTFALINADDPYSRSNVSTWTVWSPLTPANNPATGQPSIIGTARAGETVGVNTSAIADADGLGTFTYQWMRGGSPISGATSSTYAPVAGDVGQNLSVAVSFNDGEGNAEGPLVSNAVVVQAAAVGDTTDPSLTIQGVPSSVSDTTSFTATFEFSESVSGFAVGDISVTNASVSNFTVVDGNTYTASITPDGNGHISISVAAGAAQDTAGNDSAAAQASVTYDAGSSGDTTPPVISGPGDLTVTLAAGQTTLSRDHVEVQAWLGQFVAVDAVVGSVSVAHNVPAQMLLSNSPVAVTFSATDGTNSQTLQRQIILVEGQGQAISPARGNDAYQMKTGYWRRVEGR